MPNENIKRTQINIGDRAAPLIARVNRRAKSLILKVDQATGEIHVTAPSKRALPAAIAFAQQRSSWIASHLNDALLARPFMPGGEALLRGRNHLIRHDSLSRIPVQIAEDTVLQLVVGGGTDHLNRRLVDWLKKQARADLVAASDRYCDALGVQRGPVTIRDQRSRWGSCSSTGALSYSWRLIMAPSWILNYVAAHECTHLIHMNHGAAFWRQVKALGVDARGAEDWFAKHGPSLFAYGGGQQRREAA